MAPPDADKTLPSSRERLAAALALHRNGRFSEAATHYELILRDDPEAFDAIQLLGVLSIHIGQNERAVALFSQALKQQPKAAGLHANLGVALKELGRFDQAIGCYDKAIGLQPDFPASFYNKGVALAALRRLDQALENYSQAIALKPDYAEAFCDRGNVRLELQSNDAGLEDYDRAIALQPGYALAHFNRGIALRRMGRLPDALGAFDRSIGLRPEHAEAHYNRACVLKDLRRFDEAAEGYRRASALKPDFAEAYCQLGAVSRLAGRPREAIAAFDRALAQRTDFFEAHWGRGLALHSLGRLEDAVTSLGMAAERANGRVDPHFMLGLALQGLKRFAQAIACFDQVLTLDPAHVSAHCQRGLALHRLKRVDEAIASFDRAIAIAPAFPEAYLSRALCRLTIGDYERGWRDYAWRVRARARSFRREFPKPPWSGAETLEGKTLFIHGEQGFGDLFQFGRYALLARTRAARVILEVRPSLIGLFKQWEPGVTIIAETEMPPNFDEHCPLMSLPGAFATTLATIPNTVPYLHANAERIERWRATLGPEGFKIGLCWRVGNADIDPGRSFEVSHVATLSLIPGVRLISLQIGGEQDQLELSDQGPRIETFALLASDAGFFAETAALIEACDLVVTCDTAVAHLAGALAKPTWVALKFVSEWRWLLDRADSPWYPNLRLFRQKSDGDWSSVFEEMKAALVEMLNDVEVKRAE